MTVEEVKTELEKAISGLNSIGFDSIDSQMMKKLNELTVIAGALNMKEGKRLIQNLVNAMKSVREGNPKKESCNVRLMALDFYVKKLSNVENLEDY